MKDLITHFTNTGCSMVQSNDRTMEQPVDSRRPVSNAVVRRFIALSHDCAIDRSIGVDYYPATTEPEPTGPDQDE